LYLYTYNELYTVCSRINSVIYSLMIDVIKIIISSLLYSIDLGTDWVT